MSELTNPANSFITPSGTSQKNSSRLKSFVDKQADGNQFIIEQLEQRLMFSADLAPVVFDGGLPDENIMDESPVLETGLVPGAVESGDAAATGQQRHEIIFIDAGVQDYEQLVDDLSAGTGDGVRVEVFILDNSRDGIEQISEVLANYKDIDAVHLVSHGADGLVQLGNAQLNPETLDSYADDIEGWQDALTGKADILFYGCDLAAGEDGRALMESLTFITGADVAASVDKTGNALLGADWDLEYTTGVIETGIAFSIDFQEAWSYSLAATVRDEFNTSGSLAGDDGTQSWSTNWQLLSGSVSVTTDGSEAYAMYFSDSNSGNVWRQADLSGAVSATLNFDYRRVDLERSDDFTIYASSNGGAWEQVAVIPGVGGSGITDSSYVSMTIDISSYIASDTAIRFYTSNFGSGGIDGMWIDNVQIEYDTMPTASDSTVTTSEDTTYTFNASDFNFSDADGDTLASVKITTLETVGALQLSGVDVTLDQVISIADINAGNLRFVPVPNSNGTGYDSFGFSVNDGTVDSASSYTMTIDVTPVNDAPTATNLNASENYIEDTPLNLTDIVVSDVDSANVTVTLTLSDTAAGSLSTGASNAVTSTYDAVSGIWTASGAIADVNTLLAGVTFTPALNYNSDFTIATSVDDGVASPVTGAKNMTGTAVNDAPTATNLSAPETYTEDTPLDLTDIVVSDVDSATVTATLTLSDVAAGSLSTGTSGAVTSTYDAVSGIWTASGAIADVNTLLAGVTFTPALNYNSDFTIATSVDDGVASPVTGAKNMTGTAVNDAPTATNLSASETYTEDTPLDLTDIVVSDVDSASVTVTLTLSDVAAGSLSTGTSGVVTSTYDAVSGIWTASGAVADVNTLLAGVTFTPALNYNSDFTIAASVRDGSSSITGTKNMTGAPVNDAPTGSVTISGTLTEGQTLTANNTIADADGLGAFSYQWKRDGADISGATGSAYTLVNADAGATITVTISYTDGDGAVESITSAATAAVAAVNDAPTATNLSAPESYTEDTALNLTDIVVSDVDSANVTVTLTLSDTAAGSLSAGTSGSVTSTYDAVSGIWRANGAIADVNTLLAGVTFTPALNYNSNFTIAASVSDGTASPVTGIKNMTGTPVGDTPQVKNIITMINHQSGLIVIDRNASDGAEVTHFRISNITNGTLYHTDGTTRINNGNYITYAQARAGLRFTPSTDSFANGSFDAESSENGVSVAAQSGVSTSIITIALPIDEDTGRPLSEGNETSPDDSAKTADKEDILSEINNSDIKTNAQAYTITKVSGASRHSSGDAGRPESVINTTLRSLMEPFSMNRPVRENAALTLFKEEGVEDAANIEEDIYSSIEIALKSIESIARQEKITTKAIVGGTLVLSVGLATWVLRGGSILASALTTMPLWKGFDPLPVLPLSRKERHKKIREVRTIEDEENMEDKEVTELFDAGKAEQTKNDRKDDES